MYNVLAYLPEPLYLLAATSVVAIDCELFPLVDVYLLHTAQH